LLNFSDDDNVPLSSVKQKIAKNKILTEDDVPLSSLKQNTAKNKILTEDDVPLSSLKQNTAKNKIQTEGEIPLTSIKQKNAEHQNLASGDVQNQNLSEDDEHKNEHIGHNNRGKTSDETVEHLQETENSTSMNEVSDKEEYRGRKRLRKESLWKRTLAKKKRNSGSQYKSLNSGKFVRARLLKRGCSFSCRYKCHKKIPESQRQKIFHEFWALGDINRQRDYISSWVCVNPKKSRTNLTRSPKRNLSRKWQFKIDGQFVTVCKTFFLDTLDISHTAVDTALKKGCFKENNTSGIASPDKRGRHENRYNKTPEIQIGHVKSHIKSFPKVDSHYCRKHSLKSYLVPGLSVPNMYQLYLQDCGKNDLVPVSLNVYRKIFDHHFNIGFYKPIKDSSDFCSQFKNSSEKEKAKMFNERLKRNG
jgi:hypothetical protein